MSVSMSFAGSPEDLPEPMMGVWYEVVSVPVEFQWVATLRVLDKQRNPSQDIEAVRLVDKETQMPYFDPDRVKPGAKIKFVIGYSCPVIEVSCGSMHDV